MLMLHSLYKKPLNMLVGGIKGLGFGADSKNPLCAQARRNIRAMNALSVFRNALFIIAVIMPFVEYKAGITPGQLIAVEALFAISLVLFEIPSGWLADVWTRKSVLILGVLLELVGFVLMWIMDSYAMLVVSQIVVAAGISLMSGTISAMLYDTLLEVRLTRLYRKLEGLRHGLGLYSVGVSGLVSGLLYAIHPDLVIGLSVFAVALSLIFAMMLYEPDRVKEVVQGNPIKDILVTIDVGVRKDPYIGRVLLLVACVFGVTNAAFWTQQPYYMALDISIVWFGVFGAGGHILGGIAAHVSHLVGRRIEFTSMMLLILSWLIFVYVFSALIPSIVAIMLLMTSTALYGFAYPMIQDEVNKRVSSSRRATLLSCVSLASRLVFSIIGFSVSGFLDEPSGVYSVLLILASILALAGVPAWVLLKSYRP